MVQKAACCCIRNLESDVVTVYGAGGSSRHGCGCRPQRSRHDGGPERRPPRVAVQELGGPAAQGGQAAAGPPHRSARHGEADQGELLLSVLSGHLFLLQHLKD